MSDAVDDDLRQERKLAAEVGEDALEDRHQEQEHPDEDEDREGQDDERVDHRALDAPLDLHLLLDLDGHAVEDRVEDPGRLAGLDHGDVQAVEHLRDAAPSPGRAACLPRRPSGPRGSTSASALSSVCCSRMTSDWTTDRPASIIVANCREKTWSERGLTRLRFFSPEPSAPISDSAIGRRPLLRSCSRALPTSGAVSWPADSAPSALIAL